MIPLSTQNQTDEAMAIMTGERQNAFDTLTAKCQELVDFNAYATAKTVMIAMPLAIIAAAALFALYIVASIARLIREIDGVARKIADGNLNEPIACQSRDELGKLASNFNKTAARLRDYVNYIDEISGVLNQIAGGKLVFELTHEYAGEFAKVKRTLENISAKQNDTMGQINQASDQVAAGSDQMSSGEQACSVEELAATINGISGQVRENAESATGASRRMDSLGGEIQRSNEQMQEMIKAMHEINESAGQIGQIISTIENISFQTNILALNAAVEGKGFAVVADV